MFYCLITASCLLLWLWLREHSKCKELLIRYTLAQAQLIKIPELELQLVEKNRELEEVNILHRVAEEKLLLLSQSQEALKNSFQSLSMDALQKNNTHFLQLAQATLEKYQEGAKCDLEKRQQAIHDLFNPVKDTLQKIDTGMRQLEKERKGDQELLKEQIRSLVENEKQLKNETSKLVKALRTPLTRGRWGEIQLRRVVELAGMLNHCDFFEQQQDDQGRYRPDLLVRLPGGRQVVIDCKVPLEGYLDAIQSSNEHEKELKLKDHARQVRAHVTALSKRSYWEHFQPTPEFVVLFLPAETFFSAALEYDPALIEAGAEHKVIIATPTTLIALLRAVSYGWKQENLSKHVEQLHRLGQDLYKRLIDLSGHWMKMGRSLTGAVDAYNKGMGSFETRVLVTARKLKEMGITQGEVEIDAIEAIEALPRTPLEHLESTPTE